MNPSTHPAPTRGLPRAAAGLALLALAGCSAPELVWVPPVVEVVPSSGGGAWVFDAEGAAHGELGRRPKPAGAGALRATAKDQSRGFAAALYGAPDETDGTAGSTCALALVDVENDVVEWTSVELPPGPAGLALGAGELGIATRRGALVVDALTGAERARYDLGPWLDAFGLARADLLVPLAPGELALVASRVPSTFQDGRVVVQRIDARRGAFELVRGEGDVPELDRLGAASVVGGSVYLAGVREQLARGAGTSRGTLHQSIVVARVDLDDGRARVVVEENQIALAPRILDVAAGRNPAGGADLVATLAASGEVRIYDVGDDGIASAPRYRNTFADATSLAWVAPDRVAVGLASGEVRFIDVVR